jgi:Lipocalin-like domain
MRFKAILGIVVCLGACQFDPAQAQQLKEQLVGVWTLVANEHTRPDGTKRALYGSEPKGTLIFLANGHYATISVSSERLRFKSNSRLQGTPEENQSAVHGSNASFGTWSADDAKRLLTLHFHGNLFPNLEGTASTRSVVLTGDELKVSNPAPGVGGSAEIVYRRVN